MQVKLWLYSCTTASSHKWRLGNSSHKDILRDAVALTKSYVSNIKSIVKNPLNLLKCRIVGDSQSRLCGNLP